MAVERHPAMPSSSTRCARPDSKLAEVERNGNKRKIGINENLAREIMELHTLVSHRLHQGDRVTQFALSGWKHRWAQRQDGRRCWFKSPAHA